MYCLDTDILSAALKRSPSLEFLRTLAAIPSDVQFTTAITVGELLYGAIKSRSRIRAERIRATVDSLVRVLPFDEPAAEQYAQLRADLESAGKPLHEADLRIAAIALANDLTMVTANVRHFERVPGLRVENWLADSP